MLFFISPTFFVCLLCVSCFVCFVFVYPLSHALPKPPPCLIVIVFVQVHVQRFLQVCWKTMLEERAGITMQPFWMDFGQCCVHWAPFWEHWAPSLRLRSSGLAKTSILDDFREIYSSPWAPLLHPWATLFPRVGRRKLKICAF